MLTGLVLTLLSTTPPLQDPVTVLRTMRERQAARWEAVRNYTVVQDLGTGGLGRVPLYHERIEVDGEIAFRVVPEAEWSRATTGLTREETVAIAEGMATGLEMIGEAHEREAGGAMGGSIRGMTRDMAFFLREVKHFDEDETREDAAGAARMAAAFARRARLSGRETVDGRPAHRIRAEGLQDVPMESQAGEPRFVLQTVTLWVDTEHQVPLRLVMEGRVPGSDVPVVIELHEQEYRAFGDLYEPTRRVMRLSGLMEAAATDPRRKRDLQRAREETRKAQAELARMQDQLDAMPPAQRRLIEGTLNRARQQMEMLAKEGVIEVAIGLEVIGINQGPPIGWRPGG